MTSPNCRHGARIKSTLLQHLTHEEALLIHAMVCLRIRNSLNKRLHVATTLLTSTLMPQQLSGAVHARLCGRHESALHAAHGNLRDRVECNFLSVSPRRRRTRVLCSAAHVRLADAAAAEQDRLLAAQDTMLNP